ncbi:HNH endonuclease signature motif containing protein [Leucobacter sp. 7(1)]|uniref:HNH endonuclease signature motif containing protein n=1 Tax=Leucobacter sp. 7(1) TaxID=1255613 RepID=UPI0034E9810C
MQRRITARDLHCRAPACRAPAHRCDIDHTIAATDGGPTTTTNLALLCRAHHSLKHHSDWQLTQLPGGTLKWVSPTGRITIDRPPSRVRFSTDPAPSKPRSERSTVPPEDPDTPHPF